MKAKKNLPVWFKVIPCSDPLCEEEMLDKIAYKATIIGVGHVLEDNGGYGMITPVQKVDDKWVDVSNCQLLIGGYYREDFPLCVSFNSRTRDVEAIA
jgi:hypothetical protein